jgi:hypothetical protein
MTCVTMSLFAVKISSCLLRATKLQSQF